MISAIANALVLVGAMTLAVLAKLGECLYLRPGELLALKRNPFVRRAPRLGLLCWSVVMHPFNFSDCLTLGNPHFAYLEEFMERFRSNELQDAWCRSSIACSRQRRRWQGLQSCDRSPTT